MMAQRKKLCCFDIDYTLVKSNTSTTKGVHNALSKGFNCQLKEIEVPKHAGTAMAVAREYLQANHITRENTADYDKKIAKSKKVYKEYLEEGKNDGRFCWSPLPKVYELLQKLNTHDDVKLALLSANPREVAEMKLISAEIDTELFLDGSELFGAFGCEEEERSELVRKLWSRYCLISDVEDKGVDPNAMVVIGDTPNDIACAHDNNVPCVAVATGEYSPDDLQEADCVIKDFQDVEMTVDILLQVVRSPLQ